MSDLLDLNGKNILLTGGSSGIGLATAQKLSMLKARIILIGLHEEKVKQAINTLSGQEHVGYTFDLNNIEAIEPFIKEIIQKHGPIDGFIHSAGTGEVRPINLSGYNFMLRVMNINFFSFVEIVRCITKKHAFREGMSIVGVSATGAMQGNAAKTAYNSSKAAMNAAVRSLAKELSIKNIRLNTVAPGITKTPMFEEFEKRSFGTEEYNEIMNRQYLGPCEPDDVADGILYLLSNMSKMVTGTCLHIDGGKLSS